ncbi:MAG: hypothetical protein ABW005_02375 [Burkholderiaceae bacterium]
MNRKPAHYLAMARAYFGNPRMSDRELGVRLATAERPDGYSQSYVAKAKAGNMSDEMALQLEALLKLNSGEAVLVARIHREKNDAVRAALESLLGNFFALMPEDSAPLELVAESMRASLMRQAKDDWRRL